MITVSIRDKTLTAQGIYRYELVATDGAALPAFSPGAHIEVQLGEQLTRQYSLCNAADETHRYVIGVLLAQPSRGGSAAMHALQVGDKLNISAPKNHFPLEPTAQHSVLLAGGIGITPLLAMAEQLSRMNASFELHYACRSRQHQAFEQELGAAHLAPQTQYYVDKETPLCLERILAQPAADKHLYVCGPAGFMESVLHQAQIQGWPDRNLHREYFSAAQTTTEGQGFQVYLARSQQTIDVAPEQSVLAALRAQRINVLSACEEGVCGTCLCQVLEGEAEHHDQYLTDEERQQGHFLPCVSRGKGLLTLDL